MTESVVHELPPKQRRRLIARGLLRALVSSALLFLVYFLGPVRQVERLPIGVGLVLALMILMGVTGWQVLAITRAAHPGVRAVEALAVTVPLFLLLFAASYFLLAQDDPANFDPSSLNRLDTLYFTVTTFATVGFGDITATSTYARVVVTVQMLLDLVILGAGIRVILGAVQRGRARQGS
jgi:hypothetical protein